MHFKRLLYILCMISLVSGIGLCLLGKALSSSSKRSAYAAVITSDEIPDRKIRDLLSADKLGDSAISESSLWFFLDDFGIIKKIPLTQYKDRLLSFDPRNDGYAEKLHSFFARNGKRLVFIPLRQGGKSLHFNRLEKRISALLEGIPFSLECLSLLKPFGFFLILFSSASLALFCFRAIPSLPHLSHFCLFFCLPAMCPFTFFGAWGFVLIVTLLGMAISLMEPLQEFFTLLRYRRHEKPLYLKVNRDRLINDAVKLYKTHCMLAGIFALLFFTLSIFSQIPALYCLLVFVFFVGIFVLSLQTQVLRGESYGHIRFSPVSIQRPVINRAFLFFLLPYIAAFAVALFSTPDKKPYHDDSNLFAMQGELITEEEYLAHAAFQWGFSYRPLKGRAEGRYLEFALGNDGLIDSVPIEIRKPEPGELPPFPLKVLMNFLSSRREDKKKKI